MSRKKKSKEEKNKPAWKEFEILVKEIQAGMHPKARVRHDHWVTGKSSRKRKLDVAVYQDLGMYGTLTIFDCKRHKHPVEGSDVVVFAEQIKDVSAHLGVLPVAFGIATQDFL